MTTTPRNHLFFIATTLFIACSSCSRPFGEPIRTPPLDMWPADVNAAANIIKTSNVNEEREDAADTISDFLSQCRKISDTSEGCTWQPLKIKTIQDLLGPQATSIHMTDGSLAYILGHYYAVESILLFRSEGGFVVLALPGLAWENSWVSVDYAA